MEIEKINSKDGMVYWIERDDALYAQRLTSGQYQRANWNFAQTLIQNWRNCIDVGTNNACNAIHYAKRFETVYCFEPTPSTQDLWERTIKSNSIDNCVLYRDAVGNEKTQSEIYIHPKNGGHNHLDHTRFNERAKGSDVREKVTVNVNTIDSYSFSNIDWMKIDCEGYELFVLQGAENLLRKDKPIVQIEMVRSQCRKFNYYPETVIDYMNSLGYRACSKKYGWIDTLVSNPQGIFYNGEKREKDMDVFFCHRSLNIALEPKFELFEAG